MFLETNQKRLFALYLISRSFQTLLTSAQKNKIIKEYFRFLFINQETGGYSIFFWVATFAPLAIVFAMSLGFERISTKLMLVLFIAYSALMGLSLSTIFMVYTDASIYTSFFISAGVFALMAVLGYTTKTDLTKFGSLLYMVFIGMFIAGIVNMFVASEDFSFIIACLGVFVFTGLTAYSMQQLKGVAESPDYTEEQRNKLALIGGLQLYILFINLFLSLLRIFGGRD